MEKNTYTRMAAENLRQLNLLPKKNNFHVPFHPESAIATYKEAVKFIRKEKNKTMQHSYFRVLVDELFNASKTFGSDSHCFLRSLGIGKEGVAHMDWLEQHSGEVCSLLRMVKRLHVDINYTPGCIDQINNLIRRFGGTVMTVQQMREQKKAKLLDAAAKIKAGEKMPRKKKKAVKTGVAKMGLTLFSRGKVK